jgi:quercetin 2,3-dioxygenase
MLSGYGIGLLPVEIVRATRGTYSVDVSNFERTSPDLESEPLEIDSSQGSASGQEFVVMAPREVPLGGPRAILVRRTLPHRERRMIGAWCFVDHYGPVDLTLTEGMRVPPHPHTGLQTVSWLIDGAIAHTDSVGSNVVVKPGQLNLMTAGVGISHSEDSLHQPSLLHGVQLWVALPDGTRMQSPHFEHHAELPKAMVDGSEIIVFMGELFGLTSPAATYTPIVGAQLTLTAGSKLVVPLRPEFEYGVLAVKGEVWIDDEPLTEHSLASLGRERTEIKVSAPDGALLVLLGGEPFGEEIVMWWNFIGRTHEEIEQMRLDWERGEGYGHVEYHSARLEAPAMPLTRLKARGATR